MSYLYQYKFDTDCKHHDVFFKYCTKYMALTLKTKSTHIFFITSWLAYYG